uniref:TetR/AcrR family transcriptional regulator n=1 Tax=Prevotella heparinolytica TaxID=28113 RepID=UPI0035A0CDA5
MYNKVNTRNKIINVASDLFVTKGYDETRITDIIDGLDGLTKGAIYHYFDSKEDIFNAVVNEIGNKNIQLFEEIKNDNKLSGAEKLSKIVKSSFYNENMEAITEMSPNLLDNPKLLSAFIAEIKEVTIP